MSYLLASAFGVRCFLDLMPRLMLFLFTGNIVPLIIAAVVIGIGAAHLWTAQAVRDPRLHRC